MLCASLIGGNCWFNSLLMIIITKTLKLHITGLYEGIGVHKGSVIRKAFPFYTLSRDLRDDSFVWIMNTYNMIKPSWHFLHMFYHWFREWFVACLLPSCCLDQCQYLVISTIWSIFQWNLNKITAHIIGSKMSSVKLRSCCLGPNMLKNLEKGAGPQRARKWQPVFLQGTLAFNKNDFGFRQSVTGQYI